MSEQSGNKPLKVQYATQVAADLEVNEKEQERIKAEVDALQAQLSKLQEDHALLLSMQEVVGSEASLSGSGASVTADDGPTATKATRRAAVPGARRSKGGGTRPGKRRTAAPAKAGEKATGRGAPTLRELIAGHLAQQHEPRSVSEVTTWLATAHPDRTGKATVVRSTLESLVARAKAERTKQGSSVYYTAVQAEGEATGEPVVAEA